MYMMASLGMRPIEYQYTYLRYHWQVDEKSAYSTFDNSLKMVGLSLFAPLVNKKLKLRNVNVLLFVLSTSLIQNYVVALAPNGIIYYIGKWSNCFLIKQWLIDKVFPQNLGAIIGMVSPYADSCVRSMVSMCVSKEELGKIFALISFIHCGLNLVLPMIYKSIFTVRTVSTIKAQRAVRPLNINCINCRQPKVVRCQEQHIFFHVQSSSAPYWQLWV